MHFIGTAYLKGAKSAKNYYTFYFLVIQSTLQYRRNIASATNMHFSFNDGYTVTLGVNITHDYMSFVLFICQGFTLKME